MASDQCKLVKQTGRVLLMAVLIALGSILTLGLGRPISTSLRSQQTRKYNAHPLVATSTITHYLYFPSIYHDYSPFLTLTNGDFETGDFTGWDTSQGPFSGNGSGLPQAVVSFESSWRAQLGNPSAQNGAIPVGYGVFAQTFTINNRFAKFRYRIFTNDIIRGSQTGRYFDTFEVSINTPPDQISDSERNNKGCSTTLLNPTGTIIPSEGLVLCGGHNGSEADAGTSRDLGWREISLDMQNFQQQSITLYFALWSREYGPDRYNDQALYNTWIYVDDIRLEEECSTLRPPIEGPPVNLEVKITSPENCATNLGPAVTAGGTYSGNLAGKEIWVLVYPTDLKYYIQSHDACSMSPADAAGGKWTTRAFFGGPVQQYDVIAVVTSVGNKASESFKQRLKKLCDEGTLPGYTRSELPDGITEMDTITVIAGGR